ncbi:MAG TPA: hypothetical protein VIW80_04525 [Pyrinomonadaceae bacterium]
MLSVKNGSLALLFVLLFSSAGLSQEMTTAQREEVRGLIKELHAQPWPGVYAVAIPLQWDLSLTAPMQRILEVGPAAQDALIESLSDAAIKDQVIILLGGIGNERAVGPIIDAMVEQNKLASTPHAERINLSANIALTNITVADTIWHYGGGIVQTSPPANSKELWMKWWRRNRATFTVRGITRSRLYSNYPNYGIYRQKQG